MRTVITLVFLFCFSIYASAQEPGNIQSKSRQYTPEGGVKEQNGPIQVQNIQLLTPECVFEQNLDTKALVSFIKQLESAVKSSYFENEHGELLVRIKLNKESKFELKLQYQGDLTQDFLQRVYDNVGGIKSLNTANESVLFQVLYTVGASDA